MQVTGDCLSSYAMFFKTMCFVHKKKHVKESVHLHKQVQELEIIRDK